MLEHGRCWCNLKSCHTYWNRPFCVNVYGHKHLGILNQVYLLVCTREVKFGDGLTAWQDANNSSIVSTGYTSNLVTFFAACQFVNSKNSHTATSFNHWYNSCDPAWELHRFDHNFLLQIIQVFVKLLPLFNVTKVVWSVNCTTLAIWLANLSEHAYIVRIIIVALNLADPAAS